MYIVAKHDPTTIISRLSESLILDLSSRKASADVLKLLSSMHSSSNWLACDCKGDVSATSPCLAVVLRDNRYYLRNLPTRDEHSEGCPFSYMRSTSWSVPGSEVPEGCSVDFPEWAVLDGGVLLSHLAVRSGWGWYGPEYSFKDRLDRMAMTAREMCVGGVPLATGFSQTHAPSSLIDGVEKMVSVFIAHDVDMKEGVVFRTDGYRQVFHDGVRHARGYPVCSGPFLVLATANRSNACYVAESAFYIPIASKKVPFPVLVEAERIFLDAIMSYIDWIFTTYEIEISISRVSDEWRYVPRKFLIECNGAALEILLHMDGDDVYVEEGVLMVGVDSVADYKSWSNAIKFEIRRLIDGK